MQHQRRAAGEQHRIRASHRFECRAKQHHVRENRPDQPRREFLLLVAAPMDPDDRERALPDWFGRLPARWAARQSNQRDRASLARPFARVQQGILPDRPKIRRKPVANINEPLLHRLLLIERRSQHFPSYRTSGETRHPTRRTSRAARRERAADVHAAGASAERSSVTGTAVPIILSKTRVRPASSSCSSVPTKSANGPDKMRTFCPLTRPASKRSTLPSERSIKEFDNTDRNRNWPAILREETAKPQPCCAPIASDRAQGRGSQRDNAERQVTEQFSVGARDGPFSETAADRREIPAHRDAIRPSAPSLARCERETTSRSHKSGTPSLQVQHGQFTRSG